jgi:hypothetical protein
MATSIAEATGEAKTSQTASRPRRRAPTSEAECAKPRFFLAREGKSGREPAFEREFGSEAEILVESLKTGRSFYVVYEFRSMADCSGKAPQIRKEAVS